MTPRSPESPRRREKGVQALRLLVERIARRGQSHGDPNDRRYDRDLYGKLRRMPAAEVDALLRDGDDE